MASTPPASPSGAGVQRPMSAVYRSNRSSSRLSMSSKHGGSRASDEDAKTAVKVAVRVRPPLKPSDPGFDLIPQRFRGSTCEVTTPTTLAVESAQGKRLFVFDRVFGEDVNQEGVWDYLHESINSFVQGYNVSILAYGQSGSGKSYTMGTSGPAEQGDKELQGVVPRAANALFDKITGARNRMSSSGIRTPSRLSSHGLPTLQSLSKSQPADKNWQMKATYVEIYNEQLRDLLLPESVPQSERPTVSIREDTKGRIILTGLQQVAINSIDDLLNALNFGSSIRQTDSTAVNAKSSRSHAVFSLNLVQRRSNSAQTSIRDKRMSLPVDAMPSNEGWITVDSKLHFVDLAGSERLKNTGAQGERAKEGISINAGLASLGKVISQLSSRQAGSHVSYRDSRLTRLLQDSLGGNAITYMVACVTPAEFHLSETLNTVQYAQRARAIQSRPQIQQVHDDHDKQAVIDRLRAEISFLRDQIRLSDRSDRRTGIPQERTERQNEREMELQNQLLDVQENYTALSTRHAKLISEIAKARDTDDAETPMLKDAIGDSAMDRLKRSNSFAEAVEQVVLEYEKTIQSLEGSLSNTRSALSTNESSLLEKETTIAFMETMTQKLQARIQKAMDREANNEQYLRDLESKVNGITSGEEKSSVMITDLRKELARIRESESNAEDYISTLEERLAEAEQDHEIMQREIDRLEHVVERQRSIGKLDNLLYELDNIKQTESRTATDPTINGYTHAEQDNVHDRSASSSSTEEAANAQAPAPAPRKNDNVTKKPPVTSKKMEGRTDIPASPAQSKYMADKLESVTQELFDLRVEHESTVTDFDELTRKYQFALNTITQLQEAASEEQEASSHQRNLSATSSTTTTRPRPFLEDAGMHGQKEDGQPSSSRSLSSELSLVGESTDTTEIATSSIPEEGQEDPKEHAEKTKPEPFEAKAVAADLAQMSRDRSNSILEEVEALKRLNAEKEQNIIELTDAYEQLQQEHENSMEYMEDLKTEVQKANTLARPVTPTYHTIRRKSSHNVMAVDKANRSFASLRNLAIENFEGQPDIQQNFEMNLTAIMTELHNRSEQCQSLEAELGAVRKEMESKMQIISGLTRERSSLKSTSPVDISIVGSMRDQLVKSENTIRTLHESHATREKELNDQMDQLRAALASSEKATPPATAGVEQSSIPAVSLEKPVSDTDSATELRAEPETSRQQDQIAKLQEELAGWESKHQSAMESMNASEQQLLKTIAELEESMLFEEERKKHREVVDVLQKEMEAHRTAATEHTSKLSKLEEDYSTILAQVEEQSKSKDLTDKELQTHRDLVMNLQKQIEEHESAIELHKRGQDAMQESHKNQLKHLSETSKRAEEEANARLEKQFSEHQESVSSLKNELTKAHMEMADLLQGASGVLGRETDANQLHTHIQGLVDEHKTLAAQHQEASNQLKEAQEELQAAISNAVGLEGKISELTSINDETLKELERMSAKEKKSSRLVEELEEQLNSNYDQHQAANNRLSALQNERQVELQNANLAKADLQRELDEHRAKVVQLEALLSDSNRNTLISNRESLDPRDAASLGVMRSGSQSSVNLRKSASHTSLPSPPPAIPLPPLPNSTGTTAPPTRDGPPPPTPGAASNNNNPASTHAAPSPPASRHTSKDLAAAQLVEDQEARIRTIEKHLFAEKQLTATLEEALVDLETSSTKLKQESEGWRKRALEREDEVKGREKEQGRSRYSVQEVEQERDKRRQAEEARRALEERMRGLSEMQKSGKKKKSSLNCF
ncbi:kinesin family protein-like protein [Viridothelium virens]|uniref:Kinesin family protein-like protein n=1 Tax=Viridothelium virens TaxID=1048519 RepID=A0A6A6HNA7_VIRVR|nr:kinesin family protein-like protein [Viridothelium virens]